MSFTLFLAVFTAAICAVGIAIMGRMPFPPLLIWAGRMIVILVAGATIYAGLQAQWGQ
ncbi:hypothetical protein [Mesorhizobium retamae]|uniref:GDT1 family protein n=1 Tax=Mesorhizobium retamae TaxID=2912854 RepID=A0ABS9QN26_9HYPH|nr:hypothetical protein [Mesorhizobium sp. IRAMC:0171]MCG7507989.1 hypothetical protein [Mesorhizobium sp. IRAMC:0171]